MDQKICTKCHAQKTLNEFNLRAKTTPHGQKGDLTAKCRACMDTERISRTARERGKKRAANDDDMDLNLSDIKPVSLPLFLENLENCIDSPCNLQARVTLDDDDHDFINLDVRSKAYKLAELINQATGLHWT